MKQFNTTGICIPEKHYMVDITERIIQIKKMIDDGKYFCINRSRQYGKTTTLTALVRAISDEYCVLSLDFQKMSNVGFATEEIFVQELCRLIIGRSRSGLLIPGNIIMRLKHIVSDEEQKARISLLFELLHDWIRESSKPLVLMIDEVDSATNNHVFLDFLAMLRSDYIDRDAYNDPAFWSVILAGVTDIKHMKSKIRDEDRTKVNSPWNIAVDFNIDMSLHKDGIKGMLDDYEKDHFTGMDTAEIAGLIYDYTSGYPFLVSRICQLMDDAHISKSNATNSVAVWSAAGVDNAVKILLSENNTLFDSLSGKLENYPQLKESLKRVLMNGAELSYNNMLDPLRQLEMYGFIKKEAGSTVISNRIFETLLYNYFCSEEEMQGNRFVNEGNNDKGLFIKDGALDMPLILERFILTYTDIFGPLEDKFKEKDGRELFLLYLKPIINGTGNYYIEAQTRNQRRTDIVVDYLGHQYVIELKIWRGERYNADGEKQISDYLDYFHLNTGYMLSFNFNKNKEPGVKRIEIGDKVLFEGML